MTKEQAKLLQKNWNQKLEENYRNKGIFSLLKFKIFGEPKVDRRRRRATTEEMAEVFRKHGLKCVECGSEHDLTVDHKIPLAKGGDWDMDNLQPMCQSCNSKKGVRG